MYDINGSADFYNKADYGIIVERDKEVGATRVYVDKVKFKHLGVGGMASFVYDPVSGRYLPVKNLTTLLSPLTSVSEIQCSTIPAGYLKKNCFRVLGIKYQVLIMVNASNNG